MLARHHGVWWSCFWVLTSYNKQALLGKSAVKLA